MPFRDGKGAKLLTNKNKYKNMIGIIKEDIIHSTLEGYSINGVIVHKDSEEFAKNNIGKEVEYTINYDGYRKFGLFNKEFYKKAIITGYKKNNLTQ